MDEVLNYYFDPVNWIEKEQKLDELLKKLNKYLYYDGYEIILKDKKIKRGFIKRECYFCC